MLNINQCLCFPTLCTGEECPEIDGIATLYYLDWSSQETCAIKFGNKLLGENLFSEGSASLPEPYDSDIKKLVFAIKPIHLSELKRCCLMAMAEYNLINSIYDDIIARFCIKPAVAYIETAFKLLSDSIFTVHRNYYSRDYFSKIIYFHAMLYKFWCYQTYSSYIWERSVIDRLQQHITLTKKMGSLESIDPDKRIRSFVVAVHKHQFDLIK